MIRIMMYLVLWYTCEGDHGFDEGWFIFMKAGSDTTFTDYWKNASYSHPNDMARSQFSVTELIASGTNFRNTILNNLEDIQLDSMSIGVFNENGGYMSSYVMESLTYVDLNDTTSYFMTNDDGDVIDSEFDAIWGPSLFISPYLEFNGTSFMSLHLNSGLGGLSREQFIVSVANSSDQLDNAVYQDCYFIAPTTTGPEVESVFECTVYCLTQPNCVYIGVAGFSMTYTCVLMDEQTFQSAEPCTTINPVNNSLNADVYRVDGTLSDILAQIIPEQIPTTNLRYVVEFVGPNYIDSADSRFINGFKLHSAFGQQAGFMVAVWIESCTDPDVMGFMSDPTSLIHIDNYLKDTSGNIMIYEPDMFYDLAPTKFRCMYFNTTDNLYGLKIELHIINSGFVLGHYLGIYGVWNDTGVGECPTVGLMDRPDIIPDTSITLPTWDIYADISNEQTVSVPKEYALTIDVRTNRSINTFIKQVSLQATMILRIDLEVTMECLHVPGGPRNVTFQYEDMNATNNNFFYKANILQNLNSTYHYCNIDMRLQLSARHSRLVKSGYFEVSLGVYGCQVFPDLPQNEICPEVNLLNNDELQNTTLKLHPRYPYAFEELRPSGNGLTLIPYTNADIIITLPDVMNIKQVTVTGDIYMAVVSFMGVNNVGFADTSIHQRVYNFTDETDDTVTIHSIEPYTAGQFIKLNVDIFVCEEILMLTPVIPVGDSTTITTTQTITTTTSTQTTTTSTQTIQLKVGTSTSTSIQATPTNTPIQTSSTSTTIQATSTTSTTIQATPTTTTMQATSTTTPIQATSTTTSIHATSTTTTLQATPKSTPIQGTSTSTPNPPTSTSTPKHTTKASTTVESDVKTEAPTTAVTTEPPTQNCLCKNITYIVTKEELDEAIEEIQEKLIVPAKTTSAFKRTKISAPDKRTSSKVIGTAGVVSMVFMGALIVAMDVAHIINAFNFIKALVVKLL